MASNTDSRERIKIASILYGIVFFPALFVCLLIVSFGFDAPGSECEMATNLLAIALLAFPFLALIAATGGLVTSFGGYSRQKQLVGTILLLLPLLDLVAASLFGFIPSNVYWIYCWSGLL